ncbi:tryptophan--tRNA ligase [Streptomyces sp. CC219B]|uniref:tryptophan--tRNA ligase n=1 Tax=Streptomyces sp. CC219B TaxID=3044574 RepID=UPI0024A88D8B|nr:tryptophan--tRNA ligase [Streptomyces sp. CC219B]
MTRVFSGIKPTGHLTLGNYLGAMRRWADVDQHRADALFCIVDLHALTVEHDPARVRRLSRQAATLLLASGLDPALCTVFVQSHVDEHARLSYLLECVATDGEMRRMIQYKEKAGRERERGGGVRLSLLTYPVLMAADILAYGTDEVPVGDDQTQHVELARDLAVRFNQRYGSTFVVPRAVTDSGREVVYGKEGRPGVANLLEILAACTGGNPSGLSGVYESYGALKKDTAEAVVEVLRPVQERHRELCADPGYVEGVLRDGAERARAMARPTVDAAYRAIGLLPAAADIGVTA